MSSNAPMLLIPLTVVWVGHFLVDVMIGIWPVFKTFAGIDIAVAGTISGLGAFLGEGMQLLFGSWSDKGYGKYLVIGGLLATTASLGFVYTDHPAILFALYLTTCLGSGAFHPSAAFLITNIPSNKKGLLVGLFTSGGALGMAFSQIIFTYAYFRFDGHIAWLAIPAILLVSFTAFNRLEDKTKGSQTLRSHFNRKALKSFFQKRELRMLYFTQVCGTTLFWALVFMLPDVLLSRGYEFWISFGGGHMAFVLGGALMMVPAGMLADRFTPKHIIIGTMLAGTGLFYIFLWFPLFDNVTLLALLFGMGACIGSINPLGLNLATKLVPNHKGLVSAIMMGLVWCLSEVLGQTGGGLLTKLFEDDAPAKALALLGSFFMIGIITASQLPEKETPFELMEYAKEEYAKD